MRRSCIRPPSLKPMDYVYNVSCAGRCQLLNMHSDWTMEKETNFLNSASNSHETGHYACLSIMCTFRLCSRRILCTSASALTVSNVSNLIELTILENSCSYCPLQRTNHDVHFDVSAVMSSNNELRNTPKCIIYTMFLDCG